jgi:Protein of unknown function with PCYCGC motif
MFRKELEMKKLLIVGLVTLGFVVITITIWPQRQNETKPIAVNPPVSQIATISQPTTANHDHQAMSRVPAHYNTTPAPNALRGTLAPEIFAGNVRLAYQAAKDIPEVLAQMPCYCHCDMSQGHKSLQSCFEDEHGANCGICIGEALMANNLKRQGLTPAQIRERIVHAYGGETDK